MSEVEPEITNTIEADAPVNELPPIEEEEEAPKAEPTIEPTQELKHVEPLKNNSKTQAHNEKKITCPKCAKTLTLKSYRYSHERNCQGPLESKPIKPKPKAVPIAKPQRIDHEVAYVGPPERMNTFFPTNLVCLLSVRCMSLTFEQTNTLAFLNVSEYRIYLA